MTMYNLIENCVVWLALLTSIIGLMVIALSVWWVRWKFYVKHPRLCNLYTACCAIGGFIWFWIPVCVAFCQLCDAGWGVS